MLDYSDVGEIGVYVDEGYAQQCERAYADGGLMPGSRLATTFASLRANELVWHYVVNNYLKGLSPKAFDLLYWNADSSNVRAAICLVRAQSVPGEPLAGARRASGGRRAGAH